MDQLLRRLLWLIPSLLLTTVLAFSALSVLAAQHLAETRLPLFFNPRPRGVEQYTQEALQLMGRATSSIAETQRAAQMIRHVGAAAFPQLATEIDTLPLEARFRVVAALAPVAQRMGIAKQEEIADPESALAFWYRYWRDHTLDFKRQAVKRAVERLAKAPSPLRWKEVERLDTFALPELMAELRAAHEAQRQVARNAAQDMAQQHAASLRVEHLGRMLAHVTELPWRLPSNASLEEAAALVGKWNKWWVANGQYFESYTGPRRIATMFTQTGYFRWLSELLEPLGRGFLAKAVSSRFLSNLSGTLLLVVFSCCGGYAGLVLARYLKLRGRAPAGGRRLQRGLFRWFRALSLPIPLAFLLYLANQFYTASVPTAAVLLTVATATRWSSATLSPGYGALRWLLGDTPERAARRHSFRASYLAYQFAQDLPILLSQICLTEYFLELPGLGAETVKAAINHDTAWLMVMVVATTSILGVSAVLGRPLEHSLEDG